ncbi:MAG: glucosaminidase domain-containing protein [Lewinella sp.]|nr:glucosaminidase domain-containing protein [Lewinella sp.]
MDKVIAWSKVWSLITRHWFKIGLVLMGIYMLLNKDLSFQIRLQSPDPVPAAPAEMEQPRSARRETLTENAAAQTAGITDRLDLLRAVRGSRELKLLRALEAAPDGAAQAFIRRFAHVAEAEQEKYGIPASIILANGLLHGTAGRASGVSQANNFFALPCTDDWQGNTWDGDGACLRQYENAWMCFRDHSLYLTTGANHHLTRLSRTDYQAWAEGLEAADYGDTPDLAEQLVAIIERYQLAQFDR